MSSELDHACALALGQVRAGDCLLGDPTCPGQYTPQLGRWPCLAPFSTNIEAAYLLEDEIERRGLENEYAAQVMKLVYQAGFKNHGHGMFKLLTATPEQRARAFLEAVKG